MKRFLYRGIDNTHTQLDECSFRMEKETRAYILARLGPVVCVVTGCSNSSNVLNRATKFERTHRHPAPFLYVSALHNLADAPLHWIDSPHANGEKNASVVTWHDDLTFYLPLPRRLKNISGTNLHRMCKLSVCLNDRLMFKSSSGSPFEQREETDAEHSVLLDRRLCGFVWNGSIVGLKPLLFWIVLLFICLTVCYTLYKQRIRAMH
jgi:hypothetical protein